MNTHADPGRGHSIAIRNVRKLYPGTELPALDDVSLDVAPSEFMTFLGPSGSGKTTLLSIIAGLTSLSSGSVSVDGREISGLKPHRRNLGVVFQQYALFPHMTVTKNVAYPLEQRRVRKTDVQRRVREALALVHLEDLADRYPRQLSGGQQQRVAIARAVVYEPRALLMDEPLGALDKKLRGELQREIARMHAELGMTFVFVTHDQQEALSLSDRIAVFNVGTIEQVGTPTELYERPNTLFVAQFLGDSNSFHGSFAGAGRLVSAGFGLRLIEASQPATHGDGVVVVRPERLQLHAHLTDVPEHHNSLQALVTAITYGGDHNTVSLTFSNGEAGSAKYPADRAIPVGPGGTVVTSWDPSHQSVVMDPSGDLSRPNEADDDPDSDRAAGVSVASAVRG